jgi:hypothetical protein
MGILFKPLLEEVDDLFGLFGFDRIAYLFVQCIEGLDLGGFFELGMLFFI